MTDETPSGGSSQDVCQLPSRRTGFVDNSGPNSFYGQFFFPPISFLLFLNNCTKLQQEIQKKKLNQSRFNFISLPFDLSSLPFLISFSIHQKKEIRDKVGWHVASVLFLFFFLFSLNCCVCLLPISELSLNYIPRTNVAGHIDKTPNREKIKFRFFSSFFFQSYTAKISKVPCVIYSI